jgi:hypothetical protein
LIFAEIDKMHALGADLDAQHLSGDALGFSDVLAGLADGKAVGGCG